MPAFGLPDSKAFGRAAGDATRTYLSRSRHDSPGVLVVAFEASCRGFLGKSLPSGAPITRGALTTKARTRRARLRRLNVRNSSPYPEEIPIRAGCPGGTTGSPS